MSTVATFGGPVVVARTMGAVTRRRAASRFAVASVWLVVGVVLASGAMADPKQPLRSVARRSPFLDGGADHEQLGSPIDTGGGEVGAVLPSWVRSIEAGAEGAAVRSSPGLRGSERRGRIGARMRFPVLDRWHGGGCSRGPWIRIGVRAWVCGAEVVLSRAEPVVGPYPALSGDAIVPFEYAFSGGGGTRAFTRESDGAARRSSASIGARWGLAIVERGHDRGRAVARTSRGSWVASRALRWVRPSNFGGAPIGRGSTATPIEGGWAVGGGAVTTPIEGGSATPIEGGATTPQLPVAWVRARGAAVYSRPGERRQTGRLRERARVDAREEVRHGRTVFTRIGDERFVASRDLVRPTRIAVPEGVEGGERWIDIELARQTLVAYEGERPVFATLVSTGRRPGSTPRGLFRIQVKLAHDTMDNFDPDDSDNTYSMDGVPWVQYFVGGVALHGVYWHDRFGTVRSHGCVNLAPRDARWLYSFTRPHVPDGWSVILPTQRERGTPVHVR